MQSKEISVEQAMSAWEKRRQELPLWLEAARQWDSNISILSQLRGMEVGEILSFPLCRMRYIRQECSISSQEQGRRYRTLSSVDDGVILVKRTE